MLLNEQSISPIRTQSLRVTKPLFILCALPERAWFFDGFQLRNVIFDGVGIEYKGGPIRLENVYFVNCTFDVQRTSEGQEFAKATLSHVPVTFQIANALLGTTA